MLLTIRRGESVALVGPSGCGKTTLLDLLSGLLKLQTGSVLVAGSLPQEGRRDTARMFARDALLPWLTAYRNVEFAECTGNKRSSEARATILSLLKDVGLDGFEHAFPRQLSEGIAYGTQMATASGKPLR